LKHWELSDIKYDVNGFATVYTITGIDEDTGRFMLKTFGFRFVLLVRDIDRLGLLKT